MEIKRLEIGAGNRRNPEKDWAYQDVKKLDGIDLVCDIKDLKKHLKDKTLEQINARHVLEHFGTQEVDGVLQIIYDLLQQDGKLFIEVPNFMYHAKLVFENRDEEAVIYAFGGQLDEYDFHKTGFTPKILQRKLEYIGFEIINIAPQQGNEGVLTVYANKK